MYLADLHIHSSFSRATARDCDLPHLDWWARRKGIRLLGTGDFTHPVWRQRLREELVPAGEGLYTLREDLRIPGAFGPTPYFIITGEISSIYKREGRTRKVHSLLLLPDLEAADALSRRLEEMGGNLRSDGRPILGLDCRDLLETALEISPLAELIPAHIWTPHFSLFEAFTAFDSIQSAFGDLAGHIHGVETGLSSDPPMNWRVPALDGLTLLSHSDAHSPSKLGREANLLTAPLAYSAILGAIRTGDGLAGTVEFFPQEGKYHLDGHRDCGVCFTPEETIAHKGICPVCGRKLTIGVAHRAEDLSRRPQGFRPRDAKDFQALVPLAELTASCLGRTLASKKVQAAFEALLAGLGDEYTALTQAPPEEAERIAGPAVAEGIRRLRAGKVITQSGYDGRFGTVSLLTPQEVRELNLRP